MTQPTTRQLDRVLRSLHLAVNGVAKDTAKTKHRLRASGYVDGLLGKVSPYDKGRSYRVGVLVGTWHRLVSG